jgi:hypothetical protein
MSSSHSPEEMYMHRLVQDENAKTILLNVPIESTSELMALKPPRRQGRDSPIVKHYS